jgi:hypothetical protein
MKTKQTKVVIKPKVETVGAHRGGKIEIDKRLPKKYVPTVVLHERVEKKNMDKGDSYKTAHKKANAAEKAKEGAKRFKEEEKAVMSIYHKNITDKPKSRGGKCGRCGKVDCGVIAHYK